MFNTLFSKIVPFIWQIKKRRAGHRWKYGACAMHAGHISLLMHAQSTAFPLQQWLHEPSSKLHYTYIDCLLRFKQSRNHKFILLILSWKGVTCFLEYYYFSRTPTSLKKEEVYSSETSEINKQATQRISTEDMNLHLASLSGKENRKPRSDSVSWSTANIPTDVASAVSEYEDDCYSLNQYTRLLSFPVTLFRFNVSFLVF
jgi:hypothetical protein